MHYFNSGKYQFNSKKIRGDIDRLKSEVEALGNTDEAHKKTVVARYLNNLIASMNRFDRIRVKWYINENYDIETEPIRILSQESYGLDITKYISIPHDHMVTLDYKDMWNAMAFAIASYDFGYDYKEVESRLSGSKLLAINNSTVLRTMYDDKAYDDMYIMKIDRCPFVRKDGTCVDYFGDDIGVGVYKDIANSSIKKMMAIILEQLLESLKYSGSEVEFIGIFESRVYFSTNMNREDILKRIHQSIVLRLFGRDFEFIPAVKIS